MTDKRRQERLEATSEELWDAELVAYKAEELTYLETQGRWAGFYLKRS